LRASSHVWPTIFARSLWPAPEAHVPALSGFARYQDAERQFCSAYGRQAGVFLIRPDGYIGGQSLTSDLQQVFSD